jgi:predicted exporter
VSSGARRSNRVLALVWLVVVTAIVVHQYGFWRAPDFVTDVTELLPHQPDPELEQATARLLAGAATQWVVLVGAADWESSKRAATTVLDTLDPQRQKFQSAPQSGELPEPFLSQLRSARGALITRGSLQWLQTATPADVAQRALQNLVQPLGDGLSSWRDDPLGFWGEWLRERAQWSRLRPRDGWLWIEDGGTQWIALPFAERDTAFSTWMAGTNLQRLAAARQRVAEDGGVRILAAGTAVQAEAAAARAGFEVSVIGTGSLVAVVLLTLVTFGSLRPILLVALSLVAGCAAALSVTDMVFGRVHMLTMVFGASLIGVAEDYGIHYFAARQGAPVEHRWEQLRQIAPGLWLALATSGIAYLALGLAPFPGLRQIAVFSCVGLVAAFLTVLCWFPWLDRKPLRTTAFAARFARSLDSWPRWPRGSKGILLAVIGIALLVPGLLRLRSVDDIRLLQNVPQALLNEQVAVGRILGLPSPAQVFLVSGDSQESLLHNEERLTARLADMVRRGRIGGYQALSDLVPSEAAQRQATVLIAQANRHAWQAMAEATGEHIDMQPVQPGVLTISDLPPDTASLPVSPWQNAAGKYYGLVMLQGVDRAALPDLAATAVGLAGVRWINNTARFSEVLAHYRLRLGALLVAGTLAVILLLHWRYRAAAWRAYVPTLFGGLLTLALFGWIGIPVQLFVVLSLILLLGMGIDYGIFMLEHPGDRSVWLAVAIAGVSTLLSFGLLALSTTPALRAFGLAMLIGETSIWLLTPVFRSGSFHR